MAISYHSSFADQPRSGGGPVLAFLIVVAVTLVAFHVTAAGVFEEQPTVRTHVGSELSASRPNFSDHQQVDESATLSFVTPEPPAAIHACNYQACADAYRSFKAADCSFQPYDGPRRQCRR
jgi:BA14K-like protein